MVWFVVITVLCLLEWRPATARQNDTPLPDGWWMYSLANAAFFFLIAAGVAALLRAVAGSRLPTKPNWLSAVVKFVCAMAGVAAASMAFPFFFRAVSQQWVPQATQAFGMAVVLGRPIIAVPFFALLYWVVQGTVWLVRRRDSARLG